MIDVAIATTPFLDLTFTGLDAIPRPGEERYAGGLHRSPGGGAITAVGAARLGLRTALAGPLGADEDGAALRLALEAEGIRLVPPHPGRTASRRTAAATRARRWRSSTRSPTTRARP